jgi:hypothetical protein
MKSRRIAPYCALNVLVFIAASTMSDVSFAKDDERIAALRYAENSRFRANDEADTRALELLLDDALEYVHSNGTVDTKRTFIDGLKTGRLDYDGSAPTIETIRLFGDVALIRGRAQVRVADQGGWRELDIGYTNTWVWKDKRWQMTAWRSARMPGAITNVTATASGPPRGDETSARVALHARFDAALRGDVEALERLLADDLEYCGVSATCSTKAQYLESVRNGTRKFRSLKPMVERVRMYADSAVLTGKVYAVSIGDGTARNVDACFLVVLAWRDGRWQMTNQSSTLLTQTK